jgi:hypothetical protein
LCAQILTLNVQLYSQKNYGHCAKLLALHRGTIFCIGFSEFCTQREKF